MSSRRRSAHWPPPRSCTPTGPDRRRFVPARLAEALENAGPCRAECTGSQDRSATMGRAVPKNLDGQRVERQAVTGKQPSTGGFCGENGPDETMAEPVLTLWPFACESDTLTESLRVMSPGLPIGWHTTWIGTETNRRFVTRIGAPTVNVGLWRRGSRSGSRREHGCAAREDRQEDSGQDSAEWQLRARCRLTPNHHGRAERTRSVDHSRSAQLQGQSLCTR
jgi:hypothetical protein